MTTVRIVFARYHLRPARPPDGSDVPDSRPHQQLVVLADDAGHRAVPLWLVPGRKELLSRLGRPAAGAEVASGLLETAVQARGFLSGSWLSAVRGTARLSARPRPVLSLEVPGRRAAIHYGRIR